MNTKPSHKLVIAGGGVAGIEIATAFGRRSGGAASRDGSVSVTLLDRDSAHVWKPMLHTIAAGTSDISQQQTPYIAQAFQAGFDYQVGELAGLDRAARQVIVAPVVARDGRLLVPARRIPYDTLIVAVGSQANDFGTPGVAEHCFRIDSRQQADEFNHELRLRLLQALAQEQTLTIGIVGGGATGVELAAELVQLKDAAMGYGARDIGSRVTITLIESGPRLLAGFPEDISEATKQRLESLGIRVMLGCRVTAASEGGFTVSRRGVAGNAVAGDGPSGMAESATSSEIDAALKVWAAGVKAPDVLSALDGLATTPSHQLVVTPSLQTTLDPHVYALGDCASLTPAGAGRPLAPTAQVAHQQAQHLIKHLRKSLRDGTPVPAFVFKDRGSLVSLADNDAFGSLGKLGLFTGVTFRGRLAQLGHVMLYRSHQSRLHGFWRGSLLWLVDMLNSRLRASIRLD
jgi:NADH dehydrogenase